MKKKIVFNLTIDDLQELGIIKKRRRRQRKPKYINTLPSNIKSSSDHMMGYSNEFNNTNNLKTENLRLQNDILDKYPKMINKYPAIQNEAFNNYEDRFKLLENDNRRHKD